MKIWYAPYELEPLQALNRFKINTRRGLLIKIQTRSLEEGYADCHPLVEFGDADVDTQLRRLRGGAPTPLLARAIAFAKRDGRAREENRSLFSDVKVKSHYTCTDIRKISFRSLREWRARGFTTVKLKVGVDPAAEAAHVNALLSKSDMRWRFDANSRGGAEFLSGLTSNFYERTDFIEDPMAFQKTKWASLSARFSVPCAFDQPRGAKASTVYEGVRIIKPARDVRQARKSDVITNSMDHPVGQSFAFLAAQRNVAKNKTQTQDHGLITTHLFKPNAFFDEIATNTPYFKPSEGYGIGFNDLLQRQKWIPL